MTSLRGEPAPDGPTVQVRRLHPLAPVPSYALDGDAGADLATMVDVRLAPGERALLPTGIAIALPAGFAGFVHPRSGLAIRAGLGLVNAPGTIDSGYRGEIKVIVINHDRDAAIELCQGDRIAQLVIQRVEHARFELAEQLPDSARGSGGHGSTGGATPLLAIPLLSGQSEQTEQTAAPADVGRNHNVGRTYRGDDQ